MASPFFSRLTPHETTRRRQRVRRALLEALEKRELLASDVFGPLENTATSSLLHTTVANDVLSFVAAQSELSGYDVAAQLDGWLGGGSSTDWTGRPWFELIEESYQRWSEENGLAFAVSTYSPSVSGLLAEGEYDGLIGEGEGPTALDEYIALEDASYSFSIIGTVPAIGYTLFDLEMTSQTWRSAAEVDRVEWRHRMSIVVPTVVSSSTAMLIISGGSHSDGNHGGPALSGTNLSAAVAMAVSTGSIVSAVSNVPYQPLTFAGESTGRTEDALIAKSYRNYLDGGDDFWPALLPMVKSAVRAMDTVQTVAQDEAGVAVTDFVVTGGSKRGWTTWLTAAADSRVRAISPQVINVLNMDEQMEHHREVYEGVTVAMVGGYSAWVQDYVNLGIFDHLDDPRGQELLNIVDPYEYLDRLTMPKYMINATGDEFFVPDSDQFFFDDLLGENYMRYIPNAGHGLNADAATALSQFYRAILVGAELPEFSWTVESDGSIRVTTVDSPTDVRLWQATNPENRDFRNATTGNTIQWTSSTLVPSSGGTYIASVPEPLTGHTAFMVEMTYSVAGQPMKFTTQVNVLSAESSPRDEGPRLLSVAPNSGELFSFTETNTFETNLLNIAPTELVLRFDDFIDTSNLNGIRLRAAGKDQSFNGQGDYLVEPGWIGAGDTDRIIIMRFAEPLEDDVYRLELLADGDDAVRNLAGQVIATREVDSTPTNRDIESVNFRLSLGAKILSVVPQPVDRQANGSLEQKRDLIRVYFNDDDLNPTSAANPAYYQLIFTGDTVGTSDDVVFFPTLVTYDATTDMAELTFEGPIEELVPGGGTYRLRIGSRDVVNSIANPPVVTVINESSLVGSTVGTALPLGTFNGSRAFAINGSVVTTSPNVLPLDFPGSNLEPGHRDIIDETHQLGSIFAADTNPQIATVYYNFANNRSYGVGSNGQPLFTSITPEQKLLVRQIFDIYSQVMGIDFIETEAAMGLTVVVGDMFPHGAESGPGGIAGIAGGGLAIMDGAEQWENSFGGGFFNVAMHEIGHLLGLGHNYDLPPGTIMGSEPELAGPTSFAFPGDHDVAHGLHLYRRDNRNVDVYSFNVPAGQKGLLQLEVLAERLAVSSNLDSHLTLFRRTASGGIEVVASNSASFGKDAALSIDVPSDAASVTYYIAITAKGNEDFHPELENLGSGGFSEGAYQLRVTFDSGVVSGATTFSLVDVDGTALDGDSDGVAGGNFNFWFRAVPPSAGGTSTEARTIFVDKSYIGATSTGSISQPMKNLNFSSWPANLRPKAGDVVRVAGSFGTSALTDIPAYEFGRGGVGNQVLADGLSLQVPNGVTLMVDAGTIFKLQGSQITTGSQSVSVNQSNSALQILGTTKTPVYFTSYRDETLGFDTNPLTTTPVPGDWGGIHFRNDVDRSQGRFGWERHGIFLDYVAGATIRYGGGQVSVLTPSPVVSPIKLSEARPTLLNNTIEQNANAAISADPNSFEETWFTTPHYQYAGNFAPDYTRTGPHVRNNTVQNNTINGLFVRSVTDPGGPLTTMTVAGKFDDTDIVHVISEHLIIDSSPGGNVLDTDPPNVALVQTIPTTGGTLASGASVRYKITGVDRFGQLSPASAATTALTVGSGGAVQLNNLPTATGDFVGRRLWRSTNNGSWQLVAELDRSSTSYVDQGRTLAGTLANPNATSKTRGRPNGRLEVAPGIIVKLSGSRIETSMGAQLIAEGTAELPIIFTSGSDDRYGTGSTFDTFNDGTLSNPSSGDWGGLVALHLSELSLDHVSIMFGGGVVSLPGGFAGFSAVEVHQSDARIANSRFEMNASGLGGNLGDNRVGRGPNAPSVVYVMGSQPVVVNNTFIDNSVSGTAAISTNANAMNSVNTIDRGRQTGLTSRTPKITSNAGPLIRGNEITNTGINGLVVRGQVLTTESIWDDSDIVHVLFNEIIVPDFHTYGGLTLRSRADENLVVKLYGENAGFTAMGRPLDITDRIGGAVRILGTPGFPVVLTSLLDNSVGAGFDPFGRASLKTWNDGSLPASPGDWRSIRFEPYANDRNVAMVVEWETDQLQGEGSNDTVPTAQALGGLATSLNGGDENLRLGYSIDGTIAATYDQDIYSFVATGGSMVWFDIDRTSGDLDSVIELIDSDGTILAQSTSSLYESLGWTSRYVTPDTTKILPSQVLGLDIDPFASPNIAAFFASAPNTSVANDFHSVNPHDAGMRILLPGAVGESSVYYVRIRSSNVPTSSDPSTTPDLQDLNKLGDGWTTGSYRLQIRLNQKTEIPGSLVQYADIRYATNGIEALGMPNSSPLLGQLGEAPVGPTNLGNIINSDRGSVSVAGNLQTRTDTDIFPFSVSRDSIQVIDGNDSGIHVSVVLDIDYADGFGGPDTSIWIVSVNENGELGELVYTGRGSNIADDQAAPLSGNNLTDLTRGSAGTRDAYIGPVELRPGNYAAIVTNASLVFSDLEQYTFAGAANPLARLEPVHSVRRLAIHRFDSIGAETTSAQAVTEVLFDADPNGQFVQWNLSDVTTYVIRSQGSGSELILANAMTGAHVATISRFPQLHDAAMAPDGRLVGFQILNGSTLQITDANASNFLVVNSTGTLNSDTIPTEATSAGSSGIETYTTQATGENVFVVQQWDPDGPGTAFTTQGHGMEFHALAFYLNDPSPLKLFGVGSRNGTAFFNLPIIGPNDSVVGIRTQLNYNTTNIVYRLNPETGEAMNPTLGAGGDFENLEPDREGNFGLTLEAGTQKREFGRFLSGTPNNYYTDGRVHGLAQVGDMLYAVSDQGEFFAVRTPNNGVNRFQQDAYYVDYSDEVATYYGWLPRLVITDPENLHPTTGLPMPIAFAGLTAAPRNITASLQAQGLIQGDLLIGTTANGTMYAFNTEGELQPVFPGFSYKTRSLQQGLGTAVHGFDFSPLDVNLWHLSALEDNEPGHGRPATFDGSQVADMLGDRVLYFGFQDSGNGPRQPGQWSGLYNGFYNETYNLPGGAHGAIVTKPIDLSEYSPSDLPTLYFNYLLETEGQNNDLTQNNRMRDAFRVYGAGEDGQWILLGTNNTPSDSGLVRDGRNGRVDELDNLMGNNVDAFGAPVLTQELFDNTETWRQARISLAALAGKENVRLRFEFSSGASFDTGNPLTGGIELTAVAGRKIVDGTGFTMVRGEVASNFDDLVGAGGNPNEATRFVFDHGLQFAFPGGASLQGGFSVILNGVPLIFIPGLHYSLEDSPATIAALVRTAISNANIPGVSVSSNPDRANELAVLGVYFHAMTGLPNESIIGTPDFPSTYTTPGGAVIPVVPIPVTPSMTEYEVSQAIRRAFAETYSDPTMLSGFGLDTATAAWPHHDNIIQLYKFIVTPGQNSSTIGVTTERIGDPFGVLNSSMGHRDEVALNNDFRGVFIDDIIVGFAERGEMVFTGSDGGGVPFVANREYESNLFEGISQVEMGRYQLTVRAAASYGISGDDAEAQFDLAGGRDFDTNDRFAPSMGIEVSSFAAGGIADGTTFTLSDGKNILTFEFDVFANSADPAFGVAQGNISVPLSLTSTPEQIAGAIRSAINSPTAQSRLAIKATVRGQASGTSIAQSRIIELHGAVVATDLDGHFDLPSGSYLTEVYWGYDTGFGEDLGDVERQRPQGQLLLVGNTITDSLEYGIVTAAGDRSQPFGNVGDRPYPGAPIHYPNPNLQRLAPGVVVMDNVLANNSQGGVLIAGDPGMDATVQIARVINNTFYAGANGISITGGASPTILNNIFANIETGVHADPPSSAVLGANLYQGNGVNLVGVQGGTFDITLAAGAPLFMSTANRRFYLASGSRAIDASLESLQERSALTQVKSPLGLPLSPMLAPERDVNGILRVDDPNMSAPSGMGANVFKDRGAVERADFVSPEAILLQPQDNDSNQTDRDRSVTYVDTSLKNLSYFQVLLQDLGGTGIDPASVVRSAVVLTENGRVLQEGYDYVLGYNPNSRTLRFTPLGGVWRQDSVYEITLSNTNAHRIVLPDGNGINDGDRITIVRNGTTRVFEFDVNGSVASGSIAVPFSLSSPAYEIATQLVYAINRAGVTGLSGRIEGDRGSLMIHGATTVTPSSALGKIAVTTSPAIHDLAGNLLAPNRASGLTQYTIVMPGAILDFGDSGGANVPTLVGGAQNGGRHVILPIDSPVLALGTWSGPDREGRPSIASDGDDYDTTVDFGTLRSAGGVRQGTAGPARIQISASSAATLDGQRVLISDSASAPVITFEFDTNNNAQTATNKYIVTLVPSDSAATVATKLTAAVWKAIEDGKLTSLIPVVQGNQISLGGTASHVFDLANAAGVSRVAAGNVDVLFPTTLNNLADGQWLSITDSLNRTVAFELNTTGGVTAGRIAVNVNLSTSTPQSIAQAFADAIQGQIQVGSLWLGGAVANDRTVTIIGDDEDGISFGGLFNQHIAAVPVIIQSTGYGMLDAWIDWNGDGDFTDAGERVALLESPTSTSSIATSVPIRPGSNVYYVKTPANAHVGVIHSRFRLSVTGNLLTSGVGIGGEIEDHLINVVGGSPPNITDTTFSVNEDHILTVSNPAQGILKNATDPDIVPPNQVIPGVNVFVYDENPSWPQIQPYIDVSHGTLVLNADGTFAYTPDPDFAGTDYFVYRATDGRLVSSHLATVSITVHPINDAPEFTIPASITVTERGPENEGSVVQTGFASEIRPGPIGAVDEVGQQLQFEVLAVDPSIFDVQPSISPDGTLTFAIGNYINTQSVALGGGSLAVRVRLIDDGPSAPPPNVNVSNWYTFTIAVNAVNDPPVFTSGGNVTAIEDAGPVSTQWATGIAPSAGLLANPQRGLDEASQIVTFTVTTNRPELFAAQPAISSTGVLTFTSAPDAHGVALLVIQAIDNGPSAPPPNKNASSLVTVTLTITPENDPPVAVDDFFTTDEDIVLTIAAPGLLANDYDVDLPDDEISAVAASGLTTFGAVYVLQANGAFTYDPRSVDAIQRMKPGESMIDTFTYTIRDRAGATSNRATVSITVNGVDTPPVAVPDEYNVGVGQTRALDILSNDYDVDSLIDVASVRITRLPIFGSVVVRATGMVEYTPAPGFNGSDTFGYTIRDVGGNVSNEALVSIVVNNAPVAVNDSAITYRNESVRIPVLANDFDSDGVLVPSSVQVVTASPNGTTAVQPNGDILFTPSQGFTGTTTFTYVVSDNLGLPSNVATVTIQVRNSRWQNPALNLDVNADGRISAIDALLIINYLNSGKPRFLPDTDLVPPPYLDVNGDQRVSAIDALMIINVLNQRSTGGGGEGEGEGEGEASGVRTATGVDVVTLVTPQQMLDTVGRRVVQEVDQALLDTALETNALGSARSVGPSTKEASRDGSESRKFADASASEQQQQKADDEDDMLTLLSCRADGLRTMHLKTVDKIFGE